MPTRAVHTHPQPPRGPVAPAKLRPLGRGLQAALLGCLASGVVSAAAPPMVGVPPAPNVVEPVRGAGLGDAAGVVGAGFGAGTGTGIGLGTDAAKAGEAAAAAAVALVVADAQAPEPAALPDAVAPLAALAAMAMPQAATPAPHRALAGLPLVAMLVGAALVALGWRRARR